MPTNYEMVGIFHKEFNHPMFTEPQTNIFDTYDKVQFRLDRIEEEMNELKVAKDADDFIEVVDAVCDIMYFIYGTFHVFGVNFDEQVKESETLANSLNNFLSNSIWHEALKEDLKTVAKKIHSSPREFGSPKNYSDIFKNDASRFNRQITMLDQYFSLLNVACENKDFGSTLAYLQKMELQCRSLGNMLGVDIDINFAEVHRANMTKACATEEIAQESVADYIDKRNKGNEAINLAETEDEKAKIRKTHTIYEDPAYRKSDLTGLWVVYDRATTKILKSIHVEKPNHVKVLDFDNVKNFKENQNDDSSSEEDDDE